MPHEALGGCLFEALSQLTMEAGGDAIYNRYGWKGCLLTLLVVAAVIGLGVWYLTR